MLALFFRGLVLWLGYLGCSILGDWDSLYFLSPSISGDRRYSEAVLELLIGCRPRNN